MAHILLTVTDITDDHVVDILSIPEDKAAKVLGNLHISRIKEINDTLIVETTGGAFRYFFDVLS